MKDLYNTIINRLESEPVKTKFRDKDLKPVQYIDLYQEQNLNWEEQELIPLPAVLVEFEIDKKNKTASITLHCCFEQPYDSSNISINKDKALKFLTFAELVSETMEDLESPKTGKLEPTTESIAKGELITPTYLLGFECSYGIYEHPDDETSKYSTVSGEELQIGSAMKNAFNC